MAQVPYSPVPEVAASTQALPEVHVPVNVEAFGGSIASAIRSVGNVAEKAGDEIFARAKAMAQLETESLVRDAEAEYTLQSGEMRNKFLSTEGRNTVAGLKAHISETRELQRRFADMMPNPMARRLFERSTRISMSQSVFQAARYAATQQKAWLGKSWDATLDANEADVYNSPDPATFDRGLNNIRKVAAERAAAEGEDPAVTAGFVRERESRLVYQRAAGLARVDPDGANDFYQKYKHIMTPELSKRTKDTIEANLNIVGADRIVNEAMANVPDIGGGRVSRREATEEALRIAKERYPDNPRLWKAVETAITAKISRNEQTVINDTRNDLYTIGQAMSKQKVNGQVPTTTKELIGGDPVLQRIWDRLPEPQQKQIEKTLAQNAKGDYPESAATIRRYGVLQGMALNTRTRQAFLDLDVMAEPIPLKDRRKLQDMQIKMVADKDIGAAVTLKTYRDLVNSMYPAMEAAGVLRTPANTDRHNQFLGALHDAIIVYQETNKKLPKGKDLEEMGRQLFREVGGSPAATTFEGRARQYVKDLWMPFGSSRSTPVHRVEPPETAWEKQRAWWREQGITTITPALENEFKREWRRKAFQRLFGGATTSE